MTGSVGKTGAVARISKRQEIFRVTYMGQNCHFIIPLNPRLCPHRVTSRYASFLPRLFVTLCSREHHVCRLHLDLASSYGALTI